MWMEETRGTRINAERSRQVLETGADTVATSCPFCMVMMSDGLSAAAQDGARTVTAMDISEVLAARIASVPEDRRLPGRLGGPWRGGGRRHPLAGVPAARPIPLARGVQPGPTLAPGGARRRGDRGALPRFGHPTTGPDEATRRWRLARPVSGIQQFQLLRRATARSVGPSKCPHPHDPASRGARGTVSRVAVEVELLNGKIRRRHGELCGRLGTAPRRAGPFSRAGGARSWSSRGP